jgi:RNA polymerase sigma factor (sigma-70 family)
MPSGELTSVLRHLRRTALLSESAAQTDGDLLNRYLIERDDAAFEALLGRHGAMVLGVCRRILGNEADAHDAFQATFLVFVRKAASIQPRGMVGNWLYGVAQRTSLRARAINRQRQANARWSATPMLRDPSRDQAQMEINDLLDQELSHLPDKYRAPVVLCGLEGRSLQEAARQLDCPAGTVASRLARGRELLAKRLARQGLALSGTALATSLAQQAAAAGVPAALYASTAQAASALAFGPALAAGIISSEVLTLMEGTVRTMVFSKLQWVAVICLSLSLAGGGGTLIYRASGAEKHRPRQFATPSAADQKPAQPQPDKEKVEKSKPKGKTHGYLGVMLAGDEEGGTVRIHEVTPNSPAAKAGVKVDDIVLKVGKTDITDPNSAVSALKAFKPGEKVTIRFKRGEKEKDVTITLGKWPAEVKDGDKSEKPSPAAEKPRGYFGLRLRGDTDDGQVVVDGTEPDSPAAKAGIKEEDILLKVGKDKVTSAEELIKKLSNLKEGDKVTFRIKRGEKEMDVTITAGKRPADFGKM